jgi:hypothetical protein
MKYTILEKSTYSDNYTPLDQLLNSVEFKRKYSFVQVLHYNNHSYRILVQELV